MNEIQIFPFHVVFHLDLESLNLEVVFFSSFVVVAHAIFIFVMQYYLNMNLFNHKQQPSNLWFLLCSILNLCIIYHVVSFLGNQKRDDKKRGEQDMNKGWNRIFNKIAFVYLFSSYSFLSLFPLFNLAGGGIEWLDLRDKDFSYSRPNTICNFLHEKDDETAESQDKLAEESEEEASDKGNADCNLEPGIPLDIAKDDAEPHLDTPDPIIENPSIENSQNIASEEPLHWYKLFEQQSVYRINWLIPDLYIVSLERLWIRMQIILWKFC